LSPDETFFALRLGDSVNAMLTEVTGKTLAGRWLTATLKERTTMLAISIGEK
jgi:hypothetical protein